MLVSIEQEEAIKSFIAELGYNRYVQNVVCDYYLIHQKDRSVHKAIKQYFKDLRNKQEILDNVIPLLDEVKATGIWKNKKKQS